MTRRAVLFDIGGPLDTEVTLERELDKAIRHELSVADLKVDDEGYARACRFAVEAFAPNAYQAIIWRVTSHDVALSRKIYDAIWHRTYEAASFELRPGMAELLSELHERGVRLGLAANQRPAALARLDGAGIGRFFHHREVSGTHSFSKPDPRLFLRVCADLGVDPTECVMVGDRIDNDIAPARALSMRNVLLRTGRHRWQQARSWQEDPDVEVANAAELREAVLLCSRRCDDGVRLATSKK